MSAHAALLSLLVPLGAVFFVRWVQWLRAAARREPGLRILPSAYDVFVGALTDFFDTLGIGSFATTTSLFALRRAFPTALVPATLNIGHTLPTLLQAFIYISIVRVEPITLMSLVGASTAGAWLGAGVVARLPRRRIEVGMGAALLVAAGLMAVQSAHLAPRAGEALGLTGPTLVGAATANFVLGALMTLGVGLYAPCMILVSLLGMSPRSAFPIMMGSCAFLMPVASVRFLSKGHHCPSAALGLTVGGLPAVMVAAWVVRSLPLGALRLLVIAIALYAAVSMFRSALRASPEMRRADRR